MSDNGCLPRGIRAFLTLLAVLALWKFAARSTE